MKQPIEVQIAYHLRETTHHINRAELYHARTELDTAIEIYEKHLEEDKNDG